MMESGHAEDSESASKDFADEERTHPEVELKSTKRLVKQV